MQMGQPEQYKNLDFTPQGKLEEQEMLVIPGVGTMTIMEAEHLTSPQKILDSSIEFGPDYTWEKLEELTREKDRLSGLFSKDESKLYDGYILEIERRLFIRNALMEYYKNNGSQEKVEH